LWTYFMVACGKSDLLYLCLDFSTKLYERSPIVDEFRKRLKATTSTIKTLSISFLNIFPAIVPGSFCLEYGQE
jgi:hypothetical protein